MKSVLNLATPRPQEQVQLPGGVQLHFDREVGVSLKSVLEYYQQLRVLMHAWAWAGNYFVKYNQDQILMMDLTTSLSYADRCLKDALEFGGGSLRWLERNDVLTRGKMVHLCETGVPSISWHWWRLFVKLILSGEALWLRLVWRRLWQNVSVAPALMICHHHRPLRSDPAL